jgi:charged multivesicular body protein 7
LHILRRKKALQQVYENRLSASTTLQGILDRIQSSQTDVDIVNAYAVGSDTLKSFLAAKELQIDNIDETMDTLSDILADHRDIEMAVQQGNEAIQSQHIGLDDDQVAAQLDELLEEENASKQMQIQQLEHLPSVPQTIPQDQQMQTSKEMKVNQEEKLVTGT